MQRTVFYLTPRIVIGGSTLVHICSTEDDTNLNTKYTIYVIIVEFNIIPEQKELGAKNQYASKLRSQRSVIDLRGQSEGQKSRNIHDAGSRHLVPTILIIK